MSDTTDDLDNQLRAVLNAAATNLKIQHFSVDVDLSAHKGDGFLGELYKASITDDRSKKTIDLVIKKSPTEKRRRDETCTKSAYKNEIYFYSTIIPLFKKFQQDHQVSQPFDHLPEYIVSTNEDCREMIVLRDITIMGFQMREKDLLFDEELTKFIFEIYGRFHAISFCLKDQKFEEYCTLTKPLCNVMEEFSTKFGFPDSLKKMFEKSLEALDSVSSKECDMREKFNKYVTHTMDMYLDAIKYQGNYSCILHGDCWSNNMMFKYKNSKVDTMMLLDFQMLWVGSPVYDLSYFFYSGVSGHLLNKLEHFLNIYYENFSSFAKKLGSNPDKLLPRHMLSEDWKKYARFGMLMAILLNQVKLMSKEDSVEMINSIGENNDDKSKFVNATINQDLFGKRVRDIVLHMYETNAL